MHACKDAYRVINRLRKIFSSNLSPRAPVTSYNYGHVAFIEWSVHDFLWLSRYEDVVLSKTLVSDFCASVTL